MLENYTELFDEIPDQIELMSDSKKKVRDCGRYYENKI